MDCDADVTRHVTCHVDCHVTYHVNAMSVAMSLTTSSLLSRHRQVNSHIILHVINVWHGNWICNKNYTVRDVYFHHRKQTWVGLQGARRHSMTVLKCHGSSNPWRKFKKPHEVWSVTLNTTIHDAIWDRHRYCFMTVFYWSVTKFNRHGSTDFFSEELLKYHVFSTNMNLQLIYMVSFQVEYWRYDIQKIEWSYN